MSNKLLELIENPKPFLLSKFQNEQNITLFMGEIKQCNEILDIEKNRKGKSIVLFPFSIANEKYDFVKKCGRKILMMNIIQEEEINVLDIINSQLVNEFCNINNFDFVDSEEEYMEQVKDVIEKEINNGEGANFMICRKGVGKIDNFNIKQALGLFCRLIKNEYGAYQIFCFFTGKEFLIGASPECHLNVTNKQVRMQPISGTFRKNNKSISDIKIDLLNFLNDKKEINELFMTVDEELKMMAKICPFGGKIIGPRLREMSKVIHTEYVLTGRSDMNIYDIIKESLHAATMIGSPIENAFKITQKYNNFDKEYYSSLIGILDENNNFDSSIIIRTIRIDNDGGFSIFGGGSIVKDSIPQEELLESKAKMSSILNNLTQDSGISNKIMSFLEFDHEICETLQTRNQNLSNFWFFDKANNDLMQGKLCGKKVLIIDNEDSFAQMLRHMLIKMGLVVDLIMYDKYVANASNHDLVIIGPGPCDPNDKSNYKINKLYEITQELLQSSQKIIGICLGHQILSKVLEFDVIKVGHIAQGEQQKIDLFGKQEIVGFYNTFFAIKKSHSSIEISTNNKNEIYAMRGDNFSSFQFHPESLLTQNGFSIFRNEISILLP